MNALERDFFTDAELVRDPTPYYAGLRELGPVVREPHHGVFLVSGLEEVLELYAQPHVFSSIIAPLGPFVKLPARAPGESWADVVERRRAEFPMSDMLVTLDPPRHTRLRALLGRLLTPNRLKENAEFMRPLADGLIDELAECDEVEFCSRYAGPFSLLVVADLLGVPHEHHEMFRSWLQGDPANVAGRIDGSELNDRVLVNLYPYFSRYIEQRRAAPSDDLLSRLAAVRFPDGELPAVKDVVGLAALLFAAGQETTARLLASGMRVLAEQPSLADELRASPEGIPNFVEECLRLESPAKGTFRLALRDARLAGVDIPEGSTLMAMNGAANRDARVFEAPDHFDAKRANARRNIAFGHGEHFCPGASLARAEARVSFEQLLARVDELELVDASALGYVPSFLIRGLEDLPLRMHPRV